jgi:hypothetical protein
MEAVLSGESLSEHQRHAAAPAGLLLVPVAVGELIDKITILEIKSERIADPGKLRNVQVELKLLSGVRDAHIVPRSGIAELTAKLKQVNEALWDIEDEIRDHERQRDFGARFVELARAVYHTNDRRSQLKREINELCGSSIVEEKSYAPY